MAQTHRASSKSPLPALSTHEKMLVNGTMSVIPQPHQQTKQIHQEGKRLPQQAGLIYQKANAAWIRTLSPKKCKQSHGGEQIHPLNCHLTNCLLWETRGIADGIALWQRYHDPACHDRLLERHSSHHGLPSHHTVSFQSTVLTTLEHARVQALGSNCFPGVALNLSHHFLKNASSITQVEILKVVAFIKLVKKPLPTALIDLSEKWNPHFECLAGLWEHLTTVIENQEAFGFQVLTFLAQLPEPLELKDQIGRDDVGSQSTSDTPLVSALNIPDINEPEENSESLQIDPETHPENPPQDSGHNVMSHENNTDQEKAYAPYTTVFDQVVTPTMLLNAEKMAQYRSQLEQDSAPYRQIISRLARRMIRQLMAWQRRSWLFDQEEGILDARRLANLVADPFNTHLFMQESDTPFPATVVSLLIDNSGSMKGEPIHIAAMTTEIVASALERCGVKVEILGYTTRQWHGGRSRKQWVGSGSPTHPGRLNDLLHIVYKDADTPWRRTKRHLGTMLHPDLLKENVDGEALLWAFRRLLKRPEPRRIMLVICDGSPHDEASMAANGREYLVRHLRSAIKLIETSSVQLGAVGIGQNVGRYYHRAVFLRKMEHLGEEMMGQLLDMLAPKWTSGNIGRTEILRKSFSR